jgi:dsRNA-specific ribonuclease
LSAVKAFEEILNYSFNDKEVLLEALTYCNSIRSLNYQRLEVIGDAALGKFSKNFVAMN